MVTLNFNDMLQDEDTAQNCPVILALLASAIIHLVGIFVKC